MQLIRKKKISQLPLLESTTENTYVHVVDSDENYRIEADKITASLASKTYVDQQDALKVDKVDGKSLSTEDYTTAEKSKVANIPLNTNNELGFKVDKVAGSSLVPDEDIITLQNTSGTNTGDQDLSGLVEKIDYHSLVPDTEIDKLAEYPAFEDLESSYENLTNKTSDIETNKTSVDKYPTTKGVNDWSLLKFPLKGVALDYIALYSRKIATVINGVITAIQDTWDAHNSRVVADSATVKNLDFVKRYYQMCYDNNMFDSIKFAWLGDGGSKFRTSGIYTYFTKIYSLLGGNDASQVTSTNQPYLSGNIAPNERYSLKNPNGGSNFMTHPTISFANTDMWSVTTVVNWNGRNNTTDLWGRNLGGVFRLYNGDYRFGWISADLTSNSPITAISNKKIIGKNAVITVVANGNTSIKVYVDGVEFATSPFNTNIVIENLIIGRGSHLDGCIRSHIIRSQALTPTQVTAEYNLLRRYIPEIENVTIGTQTWATSNCEMIATPQGNVIAEMQANGNVEKVVNGGFEGAKVNTNSGNHTSSIVYDSELTSNVLEITATGGGNYSTNRCVWANGAGLNSALNTSTYKWHKISFKAKSISGSLSIRVDDTGAGYNSSIAITTSWVTYTLYYLHGVSGGGVNIFSQSSAGVFRIDELSIQEIGWLGSQELYDGIYAQTVGTVEQKTYAAVKAAAMWCHYNNDVATGAVYGKLYNWFAVKLMQMDIDYYNAANPTTPWGWRVPAQADFQTLSTFLGGDAVAGGKLKLAGTTYWGSPNTGATNESGFTAIPSALRYESGGGFIDTNISFSLHSITEISGAISRLMLRSNTTATDRASHPKIRGCSLRLIKN